MEVVDRKIKLIELNGGVPRAFPLVIHIIFPRLQKLCFSGFQNALVGAEITVGTI